VEEALTRFLARLAASVYRLSGDWHDWRPLLIRVSAHVAVLTVALLSALLSTIDWPAQAAPTLSVSAALPAVRNDQQLQADESLAAVGALTVDHPLTVSEDVDGIRRQANPHTIVPDRPRLAIITYTVAAGDTIQSIAKQFGLEPTTIMWANPAVEDAPDLLRIGQEIVILPVDGVYHEVEEGDTLASIAKAYEAGADAIVDCTYNDLEQSESGLMPGTHLIVPGGEKPYEPKKVTAYAGAVPEGARGTGRFQWPVLGMITQGYWYGHRAIDIGAPTGSAVLATDGGFISFAGWTDVGYGYLIVVDHANGFATYYAHLNNIYVAAGQAVERSQVIGAVGNTGNSTGPHLHFEVRRYNMQQNPRAYLP
jgi:murein DD-endopeptidase MepM/ murein hydrolase activator NlpD